MRIGIEMIGTQSASRHRGIGRYCRNFAEAMRASGESAGHEHEFVFYAIDGLPVDQIPEGPNACLRRLKPAPHLKYTVTRLVRENPDGLDVLIVTNPLELNPGNDIPSRPGRGRGVPALVSVVYDLIPLLFPDHYLRRWPGTLYTRRYQWALERLRTYDCLLAISDATRADLIAKLNVPAEKVVAIGTGGDDRGARFEPGDDPADLPALERLGLDPGEPFVFAVTAPDPTKNLAGLIDAFALLPPAIRGSHRLALTAGMTDSDTRAGAFLRQAETRGVRDRLVLTGPVDDGTLGALYRRCAAFVFPSLYEGFGLPVLEALRCGAAVVAGNHSSLPEVAGDAALRVNTAEPASIAAGLSSILNDESLARTLRQRGPAHAREFTWARVAERTLGVLENLAVGRLRRVGTAHLPGFDHEDLRHPRIALFTPLPPTASGVAKYAEGLIEALGEHYVIDLFHDPREFPFARFRSGGLGCFDHRMFPWIDRSRPYHAVVYQMGNSPAHLFVYESLLKRPGVVVMHDPSLVFFHYERAVRSGGGLESFRRVLKATHPDRSSDWEPLLEQWNETPGAMARALVDAGLDMNRTVVGLAGALVVHSREALGRLGPFAPAKTFIVPLGANPLDSIDRNREAARERLGFAPDALIVASFGIVHPSKLNAETVDAFEALARTDPRAVFLIVGQEADDGLTRARAEAMGLSDRVRFLGRPGDDEFLALIAATDLGVALRRPPTHGESSAALLDLLRSGVPTVVTDTGSFSEYPDEVVCKVRWDDDARGIQALARALLDLGGNPVARAALGRAGLDHIRAQHAWPRVAAQYVQAIEWSTQVRPDTAAHLLYRGPHRVERGRLIQKVVTDG